jgi:hypothetical protein
MRRLGTKRPRNSTRQIKAVRLWSVKGDAGCVEGRVRNRQKRCQSMIMSYSEAGLVRLLLLGGALALPIEQVRYMLPGSHRQALRNPTDADGGLGSQLGDQFQLEGMPLASARQLLWPDSVDPRPNPRRRASPVRTGRQCASRAEDAARCKSRR